MAKPQTSNKLHHASRFAGAGLEEASSHYSTIARMSADLGHEGGGGQGERRVQGCHPLQRGAVRGAADRVAAVVIVFSSYNHTSYSTVQYSTVQYSTVQ